MTEFPNLPSENPLLSSKTPSLFLNSQISFPVLSLHFFATSSMPADDPDNIFNDIHCQFSYLSQIYQHTSTLIQECIHKGPGILIKLVEPLRDEHEDVKDRLRDFVEVYCSQENIGDTQNLEVFQLEREVYRVMRTQARDHLQLLMTVLEGLSEEEDGIKDSLNALESQFDAERTPKNVADVAEDSINRIEERLKDITSSLQGLNLSEVERIIINDMITKFAQVKKLRLEKSNADRSGDTQSHEGGDAGKNVRDVVTGMYGFRPSTVNKITRFAENRKMTREETSNHQKGIKLDDEKEELGSFPVVGVLMPEGNSEALDWEIVRILREKFEALKRKILTNEVEQFHEKGSGGTSKRHSLSYETREILNVVKSWVFRLEYNFSHLIHNLHDMMSGCEAADAKFQEFKSAMENLESCHHGLVPITVYKVLAMQEISVAAMVPTEKPEPSSARIDKKLLNEEIEYDRILDVLQEIVLQFRLVLITSGLPNAETQAMESEVLVSYEKALRQSEEALKEIERKMNWPKSKPIEDLPAGKGKMN